MTYNFDPDRWFENELRALKAARREGKITRQQYEQSAAALDKKHADICDRLDGTYQLP